MASADQQQLEDAAADAAFNQIDANHDGVITREEFMRAVSVSQAPTPATPMQQYISQPPFNMALAQEPVSSPVPVVTYSAAPPVRVPAQYVTGSAVSAPSPTRAVPAHYIRAGTTQSDEARRLATMGPPIRPVPLYGTAPPVSEVDYSPPKRERTVQGAGLLCQAMEHPCGDLFSPFEAFEEEETVDAALLEMREMHVPKVPEVHAPQMPSMHAPSLHAPHVSAPSPPSMHAPQMPSAPKVEMPSASMPTFELGLGYADVPKRRLAGPSLHMYDPVYRNQGTEDEINVGTEGKRSGLMELLGFDWFFDNDSPRVKSEKRAIEPVPQQYSYASTVPYYAMSQPVVDAPDSVPVVTYQQAATPVRVQAQYIDIAPVKETPAPEVAPAGPAQNPIQGLPEVQAQCINPVPVKESARTEGIHKITRAEFYQYIEQRHGVAYT